jgi:hypothetical protein
MDMQNQGKGATLSESVQSIYKESYTSCVNVCLNCLNILRGLRMGVG